MVRAYTEEDHKRREADKRGGVIYSAPSGRLETPRSLYNFDLAFRAAIEAEMTGRVPSPEEVAQKPLPWLQAVSLQQEWIKFHKDQIKRKGLGR